MTVGEICVVAARLGSGVWYLASVQTTGSGVFRASTAPRLICRGLPRSILSTWRFGIGNQNRCYDIGTPYIHLTTQHYAKRAQHPNAFLSVHMLCPR